jgi:hypothetical protein
MICLTQALRWVLWCDLHTAQCTNVCSVTRSVCRNLCAPPFIKLISFILPSWNKSASLQRALGLKGLAAHVTGLHLVPPFLLIFFYRPAWYARAGCPPCVQHRDTRRHCRRDRRRHSSSSSGAGTCIFNFHKYAGYHHRCRVATGDLGAVRPKEDPPSVDKATAVRFLGLGAPSSATAL